MLKKTKSTLICSLLLLISCNLQATMRCGTGLVDEGDSIEQVLQKCGEPNQREKTGQYIEADGIPAEGSVNEEDWIYGPDNGMYRYLHFINGRLVRLRSQRN
ncbi:MAG: DUF2845 domain-containing protein [Halopseudomonas sabulinigri]|tara:strand:+ start:6835 stop:7140 length:306 start_codon:yes stop_codon:yes gene_type:complete